MIQKWKFRAVQLKRSVLAVYIACRDPRTPWPVRVLAACVAAYAFSPIDLIPDPIPVLGYLDDLLLIPLGVALVVKLLSDDVWQDAVASAASRSGSAKPTNWYAAAVIVMIWLLLFGTCAVLVWNWLD